MVHCVSPFMRKVRTASGATAVQVSRSLPRTPAPPPDPGAHRLHESLAERANTLIRRITHDPRAITTITAVAPVILTPTKGNLMKNLGADSTVRLAPLVWL